MIDAPAAEQRLLAAGAETSSWRLGYKTCSASTDWSVGEGGGQVGQGDRESEQGSTPPEQMATTAFYAGLAGPGPDYGRLARLECRGADGADDSWRAASPWRHHNLPQIRLEPLLKTRAEEFSPGRIRFRHELVALEPRRRGRAGNGPR